MPIVVRTSFRLPLLTWPSLCKMMISWKALVKSLVIATDHQQDLHHHQCSNNQWCHHRKNLEDNQDICNKTPKIPMFPWALSRICKLVNQWSDRPHPVSRDCLAILILTRTMTTPLLRDTIAVSLINNANINQFNNLTNFNITRILQRLQEAWKVSWLNLH